MTSAERSALAGIITEGTDAEAWDAVHQLRAAGYTVTVNVGSTTIDWTEGDAAGSYGLRGIESPEP